MRLTVMLLRIEFQNSRAILIVSTSHHANWPLFAIPDGKSARSLDCGTPNRLGAVKRVPPARLSVK
jgi:hypothetical protein